jgi:hypothetical protein
VITKVSEKYNAANFRVEAFDYACEKIETLEFQAKVIKGKDNFED